MFGHSRHRKPGPAATSRPCSSTPPSPPRPTALQLFQEAPVDGEVVLHERGETSRVTMSAISWTVDTYPIRRSRARISDEGEGVRVRAVFRVAGQVYFLQKSGEKRSADPGEPSRAKAQVREFKKSIGAPGFDLGDRFTKTMIPPGPGGTVAVGTQPGVPPRHSDGEAPPGVRSGLPRRRPPGHARTVRRLILDALTADEVARLGEILHRLRSRLGLSTG